MIISSKLNSDLTIENVISDRWPQETLSYTIDSDECCIEIGNGDINCEVELNAFLTSLLLCYKLFH